MFSFVGAIHLLNPNSPGASGKRSASHPRWSCFSHPRKTPSSPTHTHRNLLFRAAQMMAGQGRLDKNIRDQNQGEDRDFPCAKLGSSPEGGISTDDAVQKGLEGRILAPDRQNPTSKPPVTFALAAPGAWLAPPSCSFSPPPSLRPPVVPARKNLPTARNGGESSRSRRSGAAR